MMAENVAVTGIVSIHAYRISSSTDHLTFEILSLAPAPRIDMLTTCVVLTGPPNKDAVMITNAEAN